jgi:hypothetical protein
MTLQCGILAAKEARAMGRVTARTIYTYESKDGLFELPIRPADGFEDFRVTPTEDGIVLKYAFADDTLSLVDYFAYQDPDYVQFFNAHYIDIDIDRLGFLLGKGWEVFEVEKYEHSFVQFGLAGTFSCPWDTIRGQYAIGISNGVQNQEEFAKSILEEYSSFCNGEVFGVVTARYDKQRNLIEYDSIGGIFGRRQLTDFLNEGV